MTAITTTISKQARALGTPWTVKHLKKAMLKTLLVARADNEYYPKETAANRPGNGSFYIRGRGTQLVSGRNLGNSERMSTRWKVKVASNGYSGDVSNNASYADVTIGRRQANFHARNDWPNVPKYAQQRKNAERLGAVWAGSLFGAKGIK